MIKKHFTFVKNYSMSENNSSQAYISHVHLKGYKSIRDMEIRLNKGLNIIIGPNGSGKTNFVELLWESLHDNIKNISDNYYFRISLTADGTTIWEQEIDKENIIDFSRKNTKTINYINEEKQSEFTDTRFNLTQSSKLSDLLYPLIIKYKIPDQIKGLTDLGTIVVENRYNFIFNYFIPLFNRNLQKQLLENKEPWTKDSVLSNYLVLNKELLMLLNKYSPIKDVRLSNGILISTENNLKVDFINFEFFINNQWLTWQQLSDGTRRIFYIISQINYSKGLIILEEPENGVHPDQLYKLMDFIKEQSKEKQIILTTHSPEVLNILEKDELDRVIITRYDEKRGTQMHHLSKKLNQKGQDYIEQIGDLSDFWVHSNLEAYEEELETIEE